MKKLVTLLLALLLSLSMMVPAMAAADGPGGILLGSWDQYISPFISGGQGAARFGGLGSVLSGGTLRIVLAVAILAAAAVVIVICKKKKN